MPDPLRLAEPLVQRVSVPRAAAVLAEQLRRRILAGDLSEGQFLPAERTLVEEAGVGRASVREALRMLETEGLIAGRLGRYGGWEVQRPAASTVARSIDVFIRGRQVRFTTVLEAREAIEPACAALAAIHRDDADLAELHACEQRLDACWRDVPAYLRENVRWHLAVVAASHNELLIAVMSALGDAVHAATDLEDFNSEAVRQAALRAHRGVVAAIEQGDADAAFRRMHRHVNAFRLAAGVAVTAPPGAPAATTDERAAAPGEPGPTMSTGQAATRNRKARRPPGSAEPIRKKSTRSATEPAPAPTRAPASKRRAPTDGPR